MMRQCRIGLHHLKQRHLANAQRQPVIVKTRGFGEAFKTQLMERLRRYRSGVTKPMVCRAGMFSELPSASRSEILP